MKKQSNFYCCQTLVSGTKRQG